MYTYIHLCVHCHLSLYMVSRFATEDILPMLDRPTFRALNDNSIVFDGASQFIYVYIYTCICALPYLSIYMVSRFATEDVLPMLDRPTFRALNDNSIVFDGSSQSIVREREGGERKRKTRETTVMLCFK